jgi:hypothetical protein
VSAATAPLTAKADGMVLQLVEDLALWLEKQLAGSRVASVNLKIISRYAPYTESLRKIMMAIRRSH